jgi:ABC-type nickel/cobalt efflux system permease component RcnA
VYNDKNFKSSHPLTFGLSLTAGGGVILMILALAIGVIQGEAADGRLLSMMFAVGVALFIFGLGGWLAVKRPFTHFDDINKPIEDDHHGHASHDDHAIVSAEEPKQLQEHH